MFEARYSLAGLIGSGGDGRVYEAIDRVLGRRVAVKIGRAEEETRLRMAREARIGSAVSHPNVCTIFDAGINAAGEPFLVMELLRGETLATRLAGLGPLDRRDAVDVAVQVLDALESMHDLGFVHRDLKPANVFLIPMKSGRLVAKLIDLGTAREIGDTGEGFEQLTDTGVVIGTIWYMSPEQLRGERNLDARSDVFSAALLVYEMLAGEHPLTNMSQIEATNQIAFRRISVTHPRVPPDLQAILERALENDRERRFANVASFRTALRSPPRAPTVDTAATNVLAPVTTASGPRPRTVGWEETTERDSLPPPFDDR